MDKFISKKTVNKNQIIAVWNLYRTDHVVANCVNILKNYVSISCKLRDSSLEHKIDAEKLINDAFDWLHCIGLVPIVYNSQTMYIPAPEHTTLYVSNGKNSVSYECELNDSLQFMNLSHKSEQNHVLLWNGGQNLPTVDGDLTSIMYKIAVKQDHLDLIQERAYVSMYHATNPTIVSQAMPKTNSDHVGTNWVRTGEYGPTQDTNVKSMDYDHKMQVHRSVAEARHMLHIERNRMWGLDAERSERWKQISSELQFREYYIPDDRVLTRCVFLQ